MDLVNNYLFKEQAVRKTDNQHLKLFFENFDGKGKTISQCMKTNSQWASLFGRVYLVCDRPELDEEEKTGTQADNINGKAMPYVYPVYPQDVMDVSFFSNGKIRWIIIREMSRDDYYVKCLYWAVTTLTTIGYGDFSPQTDLGKIFTLFYIIIGLGMILSFFHILYNHFNDLRLTGRRKIGEGEEDPLDKQRSLK